MSCCPGEADDHITWSDGIDQYGGEAGGGGEL